MGVWLEGVGLRRAVATAVVAASAVAPAIAQAAPGPRALAVRSASLAQKGRYLVWQAALSRPVHLAAFRRQHRMLCLLIERPHHGAVAGRACVAAPAAHPKSRLVIYAPFTGAGYGHWRVIHAGVRRTSTGGLSVSFRPGPLGLPYRPLRWQTASSARSPACAGARPRAHPSPNPCLRLFPARPRLIRLHTPRLVGCAPSGPSFVTSGPASRHELALTFDDGPWGDPPTADFLNVLERHHARATFFEIGEQISTYDPTGALERRMLADGDMIGDHTWSHPDMTKLSAAEQRSQLESTAHAIKHATHGFTPCLWRPPYGAYNGEVVSLARSLGMLTINWDVDTVDWSQPGTATIYQRAVSGAHNGAIILQHFGGGPRYETLDALPHEITTLRHKGYRFVTVAQLLGLRLIYK